MITFNLKIRQNSCRLTEYFVLLQLNISRTFKNKML